jgi:uncharacterized membrane protein YdjX (TVP38/TMEM64 family)
MKKNGPLTIFLLAAIPNPLFDLAGLVAGALKMRLATFMLWVWLGETTKMFIFAYAGSSLQRFL